jgi:hypothetical protein
MGNNPLYSPPVLKDIDELIYRLHVLEDLASKAKTPLVGLALLRAEFALREVLVYLSS